MSSKAVRSGLMLTLALIPDGAMAQNAFGPFLESAIPSSDDRGRQVGVLDRPRPEYEPVGLSVGSFLIAPSIRTDFGASNNVYGAGRDTQGRKVGDVYLGLDPKLIARSNWSQHALKMRAGAELRRFASETNRNETGLDFGADSRLDLSRAFTLALAGGYSRSYQSQYASDVPVENLSPLQYASTNALARARYDTGRWQISAAADITAVNFRDVITGAGGTLDQDYRDRTVTRGSLRVEQALSQEFSTFVESDLSQVDHRVDQLPEGPNRDGRDLRVLGGASFDLAGIARAHLGAGYVSRTFDAGETYGSMNGLGYDVRAELFPSSLTTVSIGARRAIREAATMDSSGYFAQVLQARVDHEFTRNLLLFAELQRASSEFQRIDRNDRSVIAQAGALYLVDRRFRLTGALTWSDRASSGQQAGPEFNELRGVIAITAAL